MLLAVEGGGFFSSSASGYSKGLTLLLLGHKSEEKPMRVTPWSQYQLVDQETDPHIQLASGKNRVVRGCSPFVCFGRAAAGAKSHSPLKVGPTQSQEASQEPRDFGEGKDHVHSVDPVNENDDDYNDGASMPVSLKSSLKKSSNIAGAVDDGGGVNTNKNEVLCEIDNDLDCLMERRKVQWTDTIGGELFEIREFELSEDGSDDEFDHGTRKTCSCRIM